MHPVGPRSAGTYWARRVLVALVALAVLVAVVWFIAGRGKGTGVSPAADIVPPTSAMTGVLATDTSGSLPPIDTSSGASSTSSTSTSSGASSSTSTRSSTASTTGTSTSRTKTSTTKSGTAKTSTGKTAATKTSTAKTSTAKTSTAKTSTAKTSTGKTTATRSSTAPPKPSYDAQGRLLCPDAAIRVVATVGRPSYPTGSQPILGMTVTNTGAVTCVRDLSGTLQVYTVYAKSGARIWSTSDCFPGQGSDVRQLAARQTVSFTIRWSGTTSSPGCAAPRVRVQPGGYTVVSALGTIASAPTAFTIAG